MISATDETFEQELTSDIPVIVDFWAEWCGPCKSLAPIFEDLAKDYEGKVKFMKVDTDATTLAAKYNIRGIPTILLFKQGQVVNTIVGAQSKGRLQLAIDAALQ
jgi:thioredoxin 1